MCLGGGETRSGGWDALEIVLVKGSDGAQGNKWWTRSCDRPARPAVAELSRAGRHPRLQMPWQPCWAGCGCKPGRLPSLRHLEGAYDG